jgi:hypothetical protein
VLFTVLHENCDRILAHAGGVPIARPGLTPHEAEPTGLFTESLRTGDGALTDVSDSTGMRAAAAAAVVALSLAVAASAAAGTRKSRPAEGAIAIAAAHGDRLHAAPAKQPPTDSLPVWLVPVAAGALLAAVVLVRRRP